MPEPTELSPQERLRAPFPAEQVGFLPRLSCRACSELNKQGYKACDKHTMTRCQECSNYLTSGHIHLSYVGHAATTDRLLQVDPNWSWEPVAWKPDGSGPLRDEFGGMWIRLTVAGVTRLGYGDAQGKSGPNAVKEVIGDAIRNAAMRFGVALDLWSKEDLHAQALAAPSAEGSAPAEPEPARKRPRKEAAPAEAPPEPTRQTEELSPRATELMSSAAAVTSETLLRNIYNRAVAEKVLQARGRHPATGEPMVLDAYLRARKAELPELPGAQNTMT